MSNHIDPDPINRFEHWFAEAQSSEPNDPNGMALATVDADGQPSVRMVLLKGHGPDGFVFFTNLESRKGRALAVHPQAALLFHWKSLRRQIRIEGIVDPVTTHEADDYFASRPRQSRIGAWASDQSRPLGSRAELLKRIAIVTARHPVGEVPRPPHWSGYRLVPHAMEFWEDKEFRIHERTHYVRLNDNRWSAQLLFP